MMPEYQKALAFCKEKGIATPLNYLSTIYNCSLKRNTHYMFHARENKYQVKVEINGEVSEWYEFHTVYNGEEVELVSLNPDGTITGVYRLREKNGDSVINVIKTPLDSDLPPTISNFTNKWHELPEEIRAKAEHFNHKHAIQVWSDKSYGLVFEYNAFLL